MRTVRVVLLLALLFAPLVGPAPAAAAAPTDRQVHDRYVRQVHDLKHRCDLRADHYQSDPRRLHAVRRQCDRDLQRLRAGYAHAHGG